MADLDLTPSGKPWAAYLRESNRPLVSLAFVAPMLLAYEGGLLFWPQAMRNGADVWLRSSLEVIGFGQYFLLPMLTCAVLIGWHHINRDRWTVRSMVLYGMVLESMALGLLLLILARTQSIMFSAMQVPVASVEPGAAGTRVLTFFGAGIYEELLFRLMLLPFCATVLRLSGVSGRLSLIVAVLFSSLLFAAAHYQLDLMIGSWHLKTNYGDPFEWTTFLFRFSAGAFFSAVFLSRGFGITVGSHALYDILVSFA